MNISDNAIASADYAIATQSVAVTDNRGGLNVNMNAEAGSTGIVDQVATIDGPSSDGQRRAARKLRRPRRNGDYIVATTKSGKTYFATGVDESWTELCIEGGDILIEPASNQALIRKAS